MRIALITPASRESKNGNRNTATRWAGMLLELGHRVQIEVEWSGAPADLMLALHARRSHASIQRFAELHPRRPLIVTLTGTDLYRDIRFDLDAQESMRLATRMIVLQDMGLRELPRQLRAKTHVVYQSARPVRRRAALKHSFEVLVIGHLREEKDPFRAAHALAHLPAASRVRVTQLGRALSEPMQQQALELMRREPRYSWRGEQPHWRVRRLLARARLLVISSRMEGGANVISEALAARCPILASAVPGNIGMLGRDYSGYFALGEERDLARVLARAETDKRYYIHLRQQCALRRPLMTREAERDALAAVVATAARARANIDANR